jgi:hypothetical protein
MAIERKIDFEFGEGTIDIVDTTGDYDVDSNPTGYGAPNPERTDLARYVSLQKKNVNDIDDGAITVNEYGDQFTRDRDGWFAAIMFSVIKWDSGTAFSVGTGDTDVAIVDYNGVLYKAIQTGSNHIPSASPTYWTALDGDEMSGDDLLLVVNTNVVKTYKERATVFDADVYWSDKIAEKTQLGFAGVSQNDRDKKKLDDIYRKIQQALSADQRENYSSAEWIVLGLRTMGAKAA